MHLINFPLNLSPQTVFSNSTLVASWVNIYIYQTNLIIDHFELAKQSLSKRLILYTNNVLVAGMIRDKKNHLSLYMVKRFEQFATDHAVSELVLSLFVYFDSYID